MFHSKLADLTPIYASLTILGHFEVERSVTVIHYGQEPEVITLPEYCRGCLKGFCLVEEPIPWDKEEVMSADLI